MDTTHKKVHKISCPTKQQQKEMNAGFMVTVMIMRTILCDENAQYSISWSLNLWTNETERSGKNVQYNLSPKRMNDRKRVHELPDSLIMGTTWDKKVWVPPLRESIVVLQAPAYRENKDGWFGNGKRIVSHTILHFMTVIFYFKDRQRSSVNHQIYTSFISLSNHFFRFSRQNRCSERN